MTSVYAALGTAPGGSYLEDSQITPLKGHPARAVADAEANGAVLALNVGSDELSS
jgi:hypothetical protein